MQPDVLGVSEVENLAALRIFNQQYLSHYFDRIFLVEGNDGAASMLASACARFRRRRTGPAYAHMRHWNPDRAWNGAWSATMADRSIWRVTPCFRAIARNSICVNGRTLTFMANHFKSQGKSSRRELLPPDELRTRQATRVAELVKTAQAAGKLPIVFGDLNVDDTHPQRGQSLAPLMTCGTDSFADLPQSEALDTTTWSGRMCRVSTTSCDDPDAHVPRHQSPRHHAQVSAIRRRALSNRRLCTQRRQRSRRTVRRIFALTVDYVRVARFRHAFVIMCIHLPTVKHIKSAPP